MYTYDIDKAREWQEKEHFANEGNFDEPYLAICWVCNEHKYEDEVFYEMLIKDGEEFEEKACEECREKYKIN